MKIKINITKRASNNLWPIYHECNYINTTHERGTFLFFVQSCTKVAKKQPNFTLLGIFLEFMLVE